MSDNVNNCWIFLVHIYLNLLLLMLLAEPLNILIKKSALNCNEHRKIYLLLFIVMSKDYDYLLLHTNEHKDGWLNDVLILWTNWHITLYYYLELCYTQNVYSVIGCKSCFYTQYNTCLSIYHCSQLHLSESDINLFIECYRLQHIQWEQIQGLHTLDKNPTKQQKFRYDRIKIIQKWLLYYHKLQQYSLTINKCNQQIYNQIKSQFCAYKTKMHWPQIVFRGILIAIRSKRKKKNILLWIIRTQICRRIKHKKSPIKMWNKNNIEKSTTDRCFHSLFAVHSISNCHRISPHRFVSKLLPILPHSPEYGAALAMTSARRSTEAEHR